MNPVTLAHYNAAIQDLQNRRRALVIENRTAEATVRNNIPKIEAIDVILTAIGEPPQ
ncbi:hypothetical protein [Mycobacterium sp. AZCC_0083]|uniref:hypothetical protein n=1 Tax=Mycobacterium sp. AZCC_0083 TaxID=2735882 RepID=UPI00160B7B03|nr:hypothetical protein [Mycobacterium sp. AZCC_0083]MBB5167143.1 hypothetical protein [Mycobacterium sp. AZCC_0083]